MRRREAQEATTRASCGQMDKSSLLVSSFCRFSLLLFLLGDRAPRGCVARTLMHLFSRAGSAPCAISGFSVLNNPLELEGMKHVVRPRLVVCVLHVIHLQRRK